MQVEFLANFLTIIKILQYFKIVFLQIIIIKEEWDNIHLTYISSQKVLDVKKAKQLPIEKEMHLTCINGQKVLDIKKAK